MIQQTEAFKKRTTTDVIIDTEKNEISNLKHETKTIETTSTSILTITTTITTTTSTTTRRETAKKSEVFY